MSEAYREAEGVALLKKLYAEPETPISVDTEGTGLHVVTDDYCIGVSIAGVLANGTSFKHYFPVAHPTGVNVAPETIEMLEYVLLQPERLLIFANVQYDLLSLETISGTRYDDTNFIDIIVMAHLCDENTPRNKSLDSLGQHYVDERKVVDPYVEREKVTGNQNITPEEMWEYAVQDAVVTWRVWFQLLDHKVWLALPDDVWPLKQELARALLTMKRRGVRIDTKLAAEYVERGEAEMKRLGRELGYPGVPKKPTKMYPNPDPDPLPVLGPKALEDLFINRLGLPVVKRTPPSTKHPEGQISFDKEAMAEYDTMLENRPEASPEARLVKEYRGWQKAVSASYRPYLALLESDGRIRTSYKMHGTVTGRLSSGEPNLQQIPKTTDKPWNGRVKECFIGEDGYVLLNADYSQLELRLLTVYSKEKSLRQVFVEGRDIFNEMAERLGWIRDRTKTYVYATNYGAGAKKHARTFGITLKEAQAMNREYKRTYPAFAAFMDRCTANAEARGAVRLWSGRFRHFKYPSEAYKAMNSVIQGGGADLVERVMIRAHRELDNDDCRMLLQVHDSLTFEVKAEKVEEYLPKIQALMEDVQTIVGPELAPEFDIPFAVDAGFWSTREEETWKELMAA